MKAILSSLLYKLTQLEREFADKYGDFTLFALLLREDANDRWDLIVSASWFEQLRTDQLSQITYKTLGTYRPKYEEFFSRLAKLLSQDELIMLSRVVTLRPEEPFVETMITLFPVVHGRREFMNREVEGIEFQQGYVITSQRYSSILVS